MSAARRRMSLKQKLGVLSIAFDDLMKMTRVLSLHALAAGDDEAVKGYEAAAERMERILFGRSRADAGLDPVSAHSAAPAGASVAWLIASHEEKDEDTGLPLYWSNADGWGCMTAATRFPSRIMPRGHGLPSGGYWVPVDG